MWSEGYQKDAVLVSWYVTVYHSKETQFISEETEGSNTKDWKKNQESLGNKSGQRSEDKTNDLITDLSAVFWHYIPFCYHFSSFGTSFEVVP